MNVVFIIPTGQGCTIGGHAGDATPAAKLIAQTCDKIILHPNVVNASDINEMPSNALYVEGSMLDQFLEGKIWLEEVLSNKVLVVVNPPLKPETVNAVNASAATIGMDVQIVPLDEPLTMYGWVKNGVAVGRHSGVETLCKQIGGIDFDALAIATPIDVHRGVALEYFRSKIPSVNPWGGIEALVSKQITTIIGKPTAHAPVENDTTKNETELFNILYNEVVDPRKAAEVCSNCYIHCVLKGLHKAPRISTGMKPGITKTSVIAMVSPHGCIGRPHQACFDAGIPVIVVQENRTAQTHVDGRAIYVCNYLEAAGIINCLTAGITPASVRA